MKKEKIELSYTVYNDISELNELDEWLLSEAREVAKQAYAPYSNFHVGAIAKLANGEIVAGSNQENASFPAGICAERVLLSSASTMYPRIPVEVMAISYHSLHGSSNQPLTPCGICRQFIQEYEDRLQQPIRLILGGMEGRIIIFDKASTLLPLAFTGESIRKT